VRYLYASKAYKYRTNSVHIPYNGQCRWIEVSGLLCFADGLFLLRAGCRAKGVFLSLGGTLCGCRRI
ncbi:MAG: hypothetical protein IKR79_00135, partial [Bacteroidales bacterium]|nr:hypothetical protein [Bacteroidales bacterium]